MHVIIVEDEHIIDVPIQDLMEVPTTNPEMVIDLRYPISRISRLA